MFNDVIAYLRQCERCQNQKSLTPAQKRELDSVKIFPYAMKPAGVEVCPLAKADAFCHLIFCTNYLSK